MIKHGVVVMVMKKSLTVSAMGIEKELPLDFAPGMIGMIPVFDTEENARAYGGDNELSELQYESEA
jgi:hypothetical protein